MTVTDDPRPASPAQLAWLGREVAEWRAEGLVTEDQAARLLDRYHAVRRLDLARLALGLGAVFVGVGLIWLVAANLEHLPPLARLGVVAAFWLTVTAATELLALRTRTRRSPVVGAGRGLAALAYGGVVMQAAQSLQVPAFEARLVGTWAAGALLYAYAVRGVAPLAVGVTLGVVWFAWDIGQSEPSPLLAVLATAALALLGFAAARLHGRDSFAAVWRAAGTVAALVGLFVAAIPDLDAGDLSVSWSVLLVGGVAVALGGLSLRTGAGRDAVELTVGPMVAVLGYLLLVWQPDTDLQQVGAEDWLHAAASVAGYVLLAAGLAAVGVLRDDPRVTWLAVAGLAVFVTFQSFAVFARIIDGAWLFLVLGVVFGVTGWLADRARREMVDALEGDR